MSSYFTVALTVFQLGMASSNNDHGNRGENYNFGDESTPLAMKHIMTNSLQVSANIVKDNIYRGELPCIVKVTLTNAGKNSLLINKRLAIGYRNSDSRELFVEIFRIGLDAIVSIEAEDYQRSSAGVQDYSRLEPEESISTSFDFCEWYELPLGLEGDFEMVIYYQADEPCYEQPKGVLKGIFASDRIRFKIMD